MNFNNLNVKYNIRININNKTPRINRINMPTTYQNPLMQKNQINRATEQPLPMTPETMISSLDLAHCVCAP